MQDLKFTYNTTNQETSVEYRVANGVDTWDVLINNQPSVFSIVIKDNDGEPYYSLYDGTIEVRTFIFEKGGLSYLPNMIEVWVKLNRDIDYTKYLQKDLTI